MTKLKEILCAFLGHWEFVTGSRVYCGRCGKTLVLLNNEYMNTPEEWEERFDKLFVIDVSSMEDGRIIADYIDGETLTAEHVKSFIREEIARVREEERSMFLLALVHLPTEIREKVERTHKELLLIKQNPTNPS